jgi:hypothetical protein
MIVWSPGLLKTVCILLTADCRYDGVNLKPSMKIAAGTSRIKEMMVMTEKRLTLSKVSYQEQGAAGYGPNQIDHNKQFKY